MNNAIKYGFLFTIILTMGNKTMAIQLDSNVTKEGEKPTFFQLEDERNMSYLEYGDSLGYPVVYCHGHPGSRLEWGTFDTANLAAEYHIRLIAIDRPGVGFSDYKSGSWLESWPTDVIQLLDYLTIDTFGVLGISGGAPYALAMANKYPNRVPKAVLVSGMGPKEAPEMKKGLAWSYAKLSGPMRKMLLGLTRMGVNSDPNRFVEQMIASLSPLDAKLLVENPQLALGIVQSGFAEALRNKTKGVSHEAKVYKKKWPFELKDIKTNVFLWHGTDDANVPVSVGHYMAQELPNCEAIFPEGEGHLTAILNFLPDYLAIFRSQQH